MVVGPPGSPRLAARDGIDAGTRRLPGAGRMHPARSSVAAAAGLSTMTPARARPAQTHTAQMMSSGARRLAARGVLLLACLAGTVRAYSCTADAQCQYSACSNVSCAGMERDSRCNGGVWDAFCSRRCVHWQGEARWCADPPQCAAGKYSPDGRAGGGDRACTPCPAGKFEPAAGSTACSECPAGKFSVATGATTVATCLACGAGTYAPTRGNSAESDCVRCPAGTYSNATGASAVAACLACGAGKYLPTQGSSAESDCVRCGVGTYSSATRATAAATCLACAVGKHLPTQGNDADEDCVGCAAGKYAGTPGASVCRDCTGASWASDAGSSACTECGPGFYFEPALDAAENPCATCAAGTYRAGFSLRNLARACGSDGRRPCVAQQSSTFGHAARLALDGNADTNFTAGSCSLAANSSAHENPWWMVDLGQRRAVSAVRIWNRDDACCRGWLNHFSVHIGDQNSSFRANPACAANVSAPTAAPFTALVNCSGAGRYLWIIVPHNGVPLSLCEVQVFQGCSRCDAGTYSSTVGAVANSTCARCPGNATSLAGSDASTDCVCGAGFSAAPGGLCTACAAGKQKDAAGTHNCTECSAGTYSTAGSAACQPCAAGKFARLPGSQQCTYCPQNAISGEGSTNVTQCQCQAGHVGPGGGPCLACAVGKYKSNHGDCAACPAGTSSSKGANDISQCKCKVGFSGSSDGQVCTACSGPTFKSLAGPGNCSSCPSNSIDAHASGECMCKPGYAGRGGQVCKVCAAGKYTNTAGATECAACAANSYSSAGVSACVQCPANSVSPLGSIAMSDCICAKNFSGPDGGPCAVCAAGKFKDSLGSAVCVQPDRVGPVILYMSVVLPYTADEFMNVKDQFTASVAKAAGVDPQDVSVVNVTEALAGRRQNLGVNVDLKIAVREPSAVDTVIGNLNLENMNAALEADGLKSITAITKAPSTSPEVQKTSIDSGLVVLVILGVALVIVASVAVTCMVLAGRKSDADGEETLSKKSTRDLHSLTDWGSLRSIHSLERGGFEDDLAAAPYRELDAVHVVEDAGPEPLYAKGCEPLFIFDVSQLRLTWSKQALKRIAARIANRTLLEAWLTWKRQCKMIDGSPAGSEAESDAEAETEALTSADISDKITAVYQENVRRITEADDILASVRDFLNAEQPRRVPQQGAGQGAQPAGANTSQHVE